MDYSKIYDDLMSKARNRILVNIYTERHHVIMKSMGGGNDENNIVKLTAKEHFVAHRLLWKIHNNHKTMYAFLCMCRFWSKHKNRSKITSGRAFAEAKEAWKKLGLSNEHKQKISKSLIGHIGSKNTKNKKTPKERGFLNWAPTLGYKHTIKTKDKMSSMKKDENHPLYINIPKEQLLKKIIELKNINEVALFFNSSKVTIYNKIKKYFGPTSFSRLKKSIKNHGY